MEAVQKTSRECIGSPSHYVVSPKVLLLWVSIALILLHRHIKFINISLTPRNPLKSRFERIGRLLVGETADVRCEYVKQNVAFEIRRLAACGALAAQSWKYLRCTRAT